MHKIYPTISNDVINITSLLYSAGDSPYRNDRLLKAHGIYHMANYK